MSVATAISAARRRARTCGCRRDVGTACWTSPGSEQGSFGAVLASHTPGERQEPPGRAGDREAWAQEPTGRPGRPAEPTAGARPVLLAAATPVVPPAAGHGPVAAAAVGPDADAASRRRWAGQQRYRSGGTGGRRPASRPRRDGARPGDRDRGPRCAGRDRRRPTANPDGREPHVRESARPGGRRRQRPASPQAAGPEGEPRRRHRSGKAATSRTMWRTGRSRTTWPRRHTARTTTGSTPRRSSRGTPRHRHSPVAAGTDPRTPARPYRPPRCTRGRWHRATAVPAPAGPPHPHPRAPAPRRCPSRCSTGVRGGRPAAAGATTAATPSSCSCTRTTSERCRSPSTCATARSRSSCTAPTRPRRTPCATACRTCAASSRTRACGRARWRSAPAGPIPVSETARRPQPFAVRVAATGAPPAGTSPLVPTPAGSTALDLRM